MMPNSAEMPGLAEGSAARVKSSLGAAPLWTTSPVDADEHAAWFSRTLRRELVERLARLGCRSGFGSPAADRNRDRAGPTDAGVV